MKRLTYLVATLLYIALPAHGFTNWQPPLPLISAASSEVVTMEVAVEKPHYKYQQFVQLQQQKSQPVVAPAHTIAAACWWRINEAKQPGARPLGDSMFYTLRRLSREKIGAVALPLKPQDLMDHGRARIAGGVKPQTVNQDITALRGTIRDYVDAHELPIEWLDVFKTAMRRLQKDQLVGPSIARERLPLVEELDLLRTFFAHQNRLKRTRTDMVAIVDAECIMGRRISELCRIERQHINLEQRTYWIYDLKNSKGKGYHGEAALIEGAWEIVQERLAIIPNEPTARLWPFNSHTCSQRYTLAKKALRREHPTLFHNLRMHDNRAAAFVRLLRKGYTVEQIKKGVSLHRDGKVLSDHYLRLKAADLHAGPMGAPIGAQS